MSYLLAAAAGNQSMMDLILTMFPMIAIFLIFYFLMFRPAKKERAAREEVLRQLKKGDRVITNGGIFGEVTKVEDQIVILKLSDNVKVRIQRQAIAGLEPSPAAKGS